MRLDKFDAAQRSEIMRRVHSQGTTPELFVRRALHAAGFRFRLHHKDLPGKPDIILPRYRLAVFVNGCFWHWHGCKRSRMPQTNRDYWTKKIQRNTERDRRARDDLNRLGWNVRNIWECELKSATVALIEELTTIKEQTVRAT